MFPVLGVLFDTAQKFGDRVDTINSDAGATVRAAPKRRHGHTLSSVRVAARLRVGWTKYFQPEGGPWLAPCVGVALIVALSG